MSNKIIGVTVGTPLNPQKNIDATKQALNDALKQAKESGKFDGVGIEKISTNPSLEDGGRNSVTIEMTDGTLKVFTIQNGSKGSRGEQGIQGEKGDTGADGQDGHTPSIWVAQTTSVALLWDGCNISYLIGANTPSTETVRVGDMVICTDGGVLFVKKLTTVGSTTLAMFSGAKTHDNPDDGALVVVKGADGKDGKDGQDGADGYTPQKGVDYFDGKDGQDGAKGEPFTYADFTSDQLALLKGEKGDKGEQGVQGEKGQGNVLITTFPTSVNSVPCIYKEDYPDAKAGDVAFYIGSTSTHAPFGAIGVLQENQYYPTYLQFEIIEGASLKTGVTSWNHLEDRPFYEEEVQLLKNNDSIFIDDGTGRYTSKLLADDRYFTKDSTFNVTWDGVEYNNLPFKDVDGTLHFGNLKLLGLEDTGEPFMVTLDTTYALYAFLITEVTANETHRHSYRIATPSIKKIDEKFLPDNIGGGSGGVSSWNDLTDKPTHMVENKTNILEWDGNKDGLECFVEQTDFLPVGLYKVYSDTDVDVSKITVDDLIGGEYYWGMSVVGMDDVRLPLTSENVAHVSAMGVDADAIVIVNDQKTMVVVIAKEEFIYEGINVTKGIWILNMAADEAIIPVSLQANTECFSSEKEQIRKEYLPSVEEQLQTVGMTNIFEWDINHDGKEIITVPNSDGTICNIVKESDYVDIELSDLIGGSVTYVARDSGNEYEYELTTENTMDLSSMGINGIVHTQLGYMFAIVKDESVTMQGLTLTKGFWVFHYPESDNYNKSIKFVTNCFFGTTYTKLPQECLPTEVATKEYVEQVILGGAW